ncbi:cellulose binding domain-containing protein, partial [Kitasatospora sp. NPDC059571]|uniref:cellulose binding domain-containing protein n=1 Tax=Kitasatospora sp. NPDC059571 TaxID=3346871 RepID=UPI0036C6B085
PDLPRTILRPGASGGLTCNARLAPNGGNSAEFGFVGGNNGANPSPTVFRLNGTVCRTVI